MKQTPFYSVIVTNYNKENELARCLDSLCKQTFKNFEVLVCDDGSHDKSEAVAKSFEKSLDLRFLTWPNWGGPARGRNIGIKEARGEWICFLDNDDWWTPNKLAAVKPVILGEGVKLVDVLYHPLEKRDDRGRRGKARGRQLKSPVLKDILMYGNALSNSSVVVRRDLLLEVGGLSEDKSLVEDYELWVRLAKKTEKFFYLDRVLGFYWEEGEHISAPSENVVRKIENVVRHHSGDLAPHEKVQAELTLLYIRLRNLGGGLPAGERRNLYRQILLGSKSWRMKSRALVYYFKSFLKKKELR